MKTESHVLNEIYATRYAGNEPKYALIVSHGLGGHGGIYNVFCEHHAARGADIWSYDAPGHGRSTTTKARGTWTMSDWAQASRDYAEHVTSTTGLPVFTMGSSLGVAAAISAIDSPAVTGAICMGSAAVPGSTLLTPMAEMWRNEDVIKVLATVGRAARLDINLFFNFDIDYGFTGAGEAKKLDPYNTWSYDLESWASLFQYQPPINPADNTKPVLYTAGDQDPNFPPAAFEAITASIGGPVTKKLFKDAGHQLMLFKTAEFSDAVHEFCLANIS